ncbi:hypothetical protein M8C21_021220 [Ambrosia artemisiifolia]|uniref:glutathione transferase n=1 Tax=Ambrosia artemisiifolia TaxID=4212 RepID=A0AAD5CY45_AMBAR|nr:hypothetical protein M8C21_021220 [Ambrosia artemisiifolia]
MTDEVKLYGLWRSPFVCRVKIALNIKGIKYEFIEEDLENKSADLVKYNPVYEKVPVLVHNRNPISESLVIIEYIDEVWKGIPILPHDAYEKAQARFWAKFINDTCIPALYKAIGSHGEEQDVVEANKQLQFLENELNVKGDNINLVDISATFIAYWVGVVEEIIERSDKYITCQAVKDGLPPRDTLLAFLKNLFCKCAPAVTKAFISHGEEQAVAELHEQLQFLENELKVKGSKFFGGDNINLVDITATFLAYWVGAAEEALGIEVLNKDKFPKLTKWCDNYINCQAVKDILPPREHIVAFFKKQVKIALNVKDIKYDFVVEDLINKSADLVKYNPVPVLVHNGNPISESLVIVEYIDDVWKGVPILPHDAYEKAQCLPALFKAIGSHAQEQAVVEAHEQLQFLENELNIKGSKFFGGDNINLVDISATFIAYWVGAAEEALGITLVTKDKFPKLKEWSDNYINCQAVKDSLPPREVLVGFFKSRKDKL